MSTSKRDLEKGFYERHSPGVYEKAKDATVGIAGLGGLGSTIAIALARTGIGKLILVDFDKIEPSNLNRQQYNADQVGKLKTDALKENLSKINPFIKIEPHTVKLTPENVPEIFKHIDILVEAFDKADQKSMLYGSFASAYPEKPVVMASGLAGYGMSNKIRTRKVTSNLYITGDMVSGARPGMGLMAPRVGIAAAHQANTVLALIMGGEIE